MKQIIIIASRPVDPYEYPQPARKLWFRTVEDAIARGDQAPPIYPGSIELLCLKCGIRISVGPRQQEKLATLTAEQIALTLCLLCAAHNVGRNPEDYDVRNLGNPYRS